MPTGLLPDEAKSLPGILNRVQSWLVAADQKVSVITAIQAIVCGFLFPELRDWAEDKHTSVLIRLGLLVGTGVMLWAIALSLKALFPVIKVPKALPSVTFFGTIQTFSLDEYRRKVTEMTDDDWRDDYTSQIQINSMIATEKLQFIQRSVKWFVAGIVVIGACYFLALAGI